MPDTAARVAGAAPAQPRRAVIDRAWRTVGPGVEVLSADDGGPLTRTVKRILDPLVLRLRANPEFSAPVLPAEVAAAMHSAIVGHADQLRAAALESKVTGPRVHDARVAVLCLHHGVDELWSADRDFGRFAGLKVRNPLVS